MIEVITLSHASTQVAACCLSRKYLVPILLSCVLVSACQVGVEPSDPIGPTYNPNATSIPSTTEIKPPTVIPTEKTEIAPTETRTFLNDLFDITVLEESNAQIDFEGGVGTYPKGLSTLYLSTDLSTENPHENRTRELWISSEDGRLRTPILSFAGFHLIATSRDPGAQLVSLASFKDDQLEVWRLNWGSENIRGVLISNIQMISNDDMPFNSTFGFNYAFSPDTRWLVWECTPNESYAWCLLDLERMETLAVFPYGRANPFPDMIATQRFAWSPESNFFLTDCPLDDSEDGKHRKCIVYPDEHRLIYWDLESGIDNSAKYNYGYRVHNLVQPIQNGLLLYRSIEGDEGEEILLSFLEQGCYTSGSCQERVLFSYPQSDDWEAVWSYNGTKVATSHYTNLPGTNEPGIPSLEIINSDDGSVQNVVRGFIDYYARKTGAWSPDGVWIVTWCTSSAYDICLTSADGTYQPLIPREDHVMKLFLGWAILE